MHPYPAHSKKDKPIAVPQRKTSITRISALSKKLATFSARLSDTRTSDDFSPKCLEEPDDDSLEEPNDDTLRSSDYSGRYSEEFSVRLVDDRPDDAMQSSDSFNITSSELNFQLRRLVDVMETTNEDLEDDVEDDQEVRRRSARFAPTPAIATTNVLSLDEYTTEELEACWYTYDEIQYMREKRRKKQKRKIFKNKKKKLQRKILKKEDTRWTA